MYFHGAEVVVKVELVGHVGAVEDEVESEGVRLGPVLLAGANEVLGTHLEGVLLLAGGVRDYVNFSAESSSPHNREMAESSAIRY